jgi:hypothetical protein
MFFPYQRLALLERFFQEPGCFWKSCYSILYQWSPVMRGFLEVAVSETLWKAKDNCSVIGLLK